MLKTLCCTEVLENIVKTSCGFHEFWSNWNFDIFLRVQLTSLSFGHQIAWYLYFQLTKYQIKKFDTHCQNLIQMWSGCFHIWTRGIFSNAFKGILPCLYANFDVIFDFLTPRLYRIHILMMKFHHFHEYLWIFYWTRKFKMADSWKYLAQLLKL